MTRILIVDDEANIREVVREYCEMNGYETDEASDGEEAIALLRQKHSSTNVKKRKRTHSPTPLNELIKGG